MISWRRSASAAMSASIESRCSRCQLVAPVLQEAGVAEDRGHRRPQLMRDEPQELVLDRVRFLELGQRRCRGVGADWCGGGVLVVISCPVKPSRATADAGALSIVRVRACRRAAQREPARDSRGSTSTRRNRAVVECVQGCVEALRRPMPPTKPAGPPARMETSAHAHHLAHPHPRNPARDPRRRLFERRRDRRPVGGPAVRGARQRGARQRSAPRAKRPRPPQPAAPRPSWSRNRTSARSSSTPKARRCTCSSRTPPASRPATTTARRTGRRWWSPATSRSARASTQRPSRRWPALTGQHAGQGRSLAALLLRERRRRRRRQRPGPGGRLVRRQPGRRADRGVAPSTQHSNSGPAHAGPAPWPGHPLRGGAGVARPPPPSRRRLVR